MIGPTGRAVILALAATAPLVIARAQEAAPSSTGVWVTLRCAIAPGPRLTGCGPSEPTQLDPARLARAVEWMQSEPPCRIPKRNHDGTADFQVFIPGATAPDQRLRSSPDWVSVPSPADFERVDPKPAVSRRLSGRIVLTCEFGPDGRPRDCAVTSEEPEGYGFGAAALALTKHFRALPLAGACESVEGAKITIPIRFENQGY